MKVNIRKQNERVTERQKANVKGKKGINREKGKKQGKMKVQIRKQNERVTERQKANVKGKTEKIGEKGKKGKKQGKKGENMEK